MPSTESVKVVIRKRPLNSSQLARGNIVIIDVEKEYAQCTIIHPQTEAPKTFAFDAVYDDDCSQQIVYDQSAFPLVESVLNGYNGTIFAYGQTGCGKTFTMLGDTKDPQQYGIIPNSFRHIFGTIAEAEHEKCFLVRCSYCEIYNQDIRDLLNYDPNRKLELKESKQKEIFVKNLSMNIVKSIGDIEKAMEYGNAHRVTKGTNMNARSSRSHAIFTIYIETSEEVEGRQIVKAGKLNLVDLAGSERQKKTGATGQTLKQAIEINLSLSALGNVISALVDGNSSHIPYRDSKLTRLLQDSLGGNTKTVMIAVVSPADYNYQESLSTLRYASRAKFIKNKPKVNQDPKDALLRQYAQQITRLKNLLEGRGSPVVIEKIVEKEKIVEVMVEREKQRNSRKIFHQERSDSEEEERRNRRRKIANSITVEEGTGILGVKNMAFVSNEGQNGAFTRVIRDSSTQNQKYISRQRQSQDQQELEQDYKQSTIQQQKKIQKKKKRPKKYRNNLIQEEKTRMIANSNSENEFQYEDQFEQENGQIFLQQTINPKKISQKQLEFQSEIKQEEQPKLRTNRKRVRQPKQKPNTNQRQKRSSRPRRRQRHDQDLEQNSQRNQYIVSNFTLEDQVAETANIQTNRRKHRKKQNQQLEQLENPENGYPKPTKRIRKPD